MVCTHLCNAIEWNDIVGVSRRKQGLKWKAHVDLMLDLIAILNNSLAKCSFHILLICLCVDEHLCSSICSGVVFFLLNKTDLVRINEVLMINNYTVRTVFFVEVSIDLFVEVESNNVRSVQCVSFHVRTNVTSTDEESFSKEKNRY